MIVIVGSFWTYLWVYRAEFIQTAFTRSCSPYTVSVESVEIQDSSTVVIKNLSLQTNDSSPQAVVEISQASFSSTFHSWLFWLLTPSRAPLHLHRIDIVMNSASPLTFEGPASNILFIVDTLNVKQPHGPTRTSHNVRGPISTILLAATRSSSAST